MSAVKPAWRGTDVSVGEVLRQLKALRAGAAGAPRNSVLDVIIIASDAAEAERAAAAVERLAIHHPCRALVVVDEPGAGSSRIDATITERGEPEPGGTGSVHEQVFLRVQGPAAEHIPSLVDSLLLPDVADLRLVDRLAAPPCGALPGGPRGGGRAAPRLRPLRASL